MKKSYLCLLFAAFVGMVCLAPVDADDGLATPQKNVAKEDAAPPKKPSARSAFMQLKLLSAQKVLEGIALEDFEQVAKHSQKISLLTLDEQWQVIQTEEYQKQSDVFRKSADAVTRAAGKKNLEAVTLAYVGMTVNCMSCHSYMRDGKK